MGFGVWRASKRALRCSLTAGPNRRRRVNWYLRPPLSVSAVLLADHVRAASQNSRPRPRVYHTLRRLPLAFSGQKLLLFEKLKVDKRFTITDFKQLHKFVERFLVPRDPWFLMSFCRDNLNFCRQRAFLKLFWTKLSLREINSHSVE
jgi:hypothetical protein